MTHAARTLAMLGIALAAGCGAHKSAADTVAAPSVPLALARAGSIVERIDGQGHVGPPAGSTTKLAFAEAGTLRTVDVRVGDRVRAGDPIAELDRAAFAAPLAQAQADAHAADASFGGGAIPNAGERSATAKLTVALEHLATLERGGPSASNGRTEAAAVARQAALKVQGDRLTLARQNELFAAGVIARKDLEAARQQLETDSADRVAADAKVSAASSDFSTALAQARADVAIARSDERTAGAQRGVLQGTADAARARVAAARVAYDNGIVAAPSDGIVLSILKHPGESVDPTTPVVEIGPSFGRDVTLTVPGDASRRIAVGDSVTYAPSGANARATYGNVVSVVPVVDRLTQVATIVASGAPPGSIEGDALTASIAVAHVSGIVVPSTAIVEDPQTGKTVVFVHVANPKSGDSPFTMRAVAVRASDATSTVVASGLTPGERVAATGGYMLLAPGGG